jgi:hypothetical protein
LGGLLDFELSLIYFRNYDTEMYAFGKRFGEAFKETILPTIQSLDPVFNWLTVDQGNSMESRDCA